MVVGELAEGIDLLVVGGGPGGYTAAARAAELGRDVLLVDRDGLDGLGGACLNVGCIPSKALIEVAAAADRVKALQPAGLSATHLEVDLARFQSWRADLVGSLRRQVRQLLQQRRVRVMSGTVRFNRPHRAAVETPDGSVTFLEFRAAVVATGSRPQPLGELPFDGERVLDSTGLLALKQLPAQVAIVGAGYIGLELGTALAKLGARVTVVEALDGILPHLPRPLAAPVGRSLARLGVDVRVSSRALGIDGGELVVGGPDGESVVQADMVMVAVGRQPNTADLGLERLGARIGAGGLVEVDEACRSTPTVAAVGDITAGVPLAHKASAQAPVAVAALSGRGARFDPTAIPSVIFTDPEIVTVGLSPEEAGRLGVDVRVARRGLASSGRAATLQNRDGFMQLVTDRDSGEVVGIHMVGPHVSELAGEAAVAIEMGATAEDLALTVHPHPTLGEALAGVAAAVPPPGRGPGARQRPQE